MGFSARDVLPFTQARANLSERADQAKAGAEKIFTKNGESYVALIDADRLDDDHPLERERMHLLLIENAKRGLADITAGRTCEADAALAFDALLAELRATVMLHRARCPHIGRRYLDNPAQSAEALARLATLPAGAANALRE